MEKNNEDLRKAIDKLLKGYNEENHQEKLREAFRKANEALIMLLKIFTGYFDPFNFFKCNHKIIDANDLELLDDEKFKV